MKKKILIGIFLFVLFSTAFIQYRATLPQKTIVPTVKISVKQSVTIDGEIKQSLLSPQRGTSALQLLSSAHQVVTKGVKENAFITAIDGRTALEANREFWAFYVNGKQAQVGAGSYLVKNNDTIEWKIETY